VGRAAFDCPYCHTCERDGGRYVCVGSGDETLKMAALARQFARQMTVLVDLDLSAHYVRAVHEAPDASGVVVRRGRSPPPESG
jgi:thioredoxin reductase